EVPTIALRHLSEAERRAFMIADNRLGELASWDDARLAVQLAELKSLDLGFSLCATGFETAEIDTRIEAVDTAAAAGSGPGGVGRDPKGVRKDARLSTGYGSRLEPVARAGDAWSLGPHRLVCGDGSDAALLAVDSAIRRWQTAAGTSAGLDPHGE